MWRLGDTHCHRVAVGPEACKADDQSLTARFKTLRTSYSAEKDPVTPASMQHFDLQICFLLFFKLARMTGFCLQSMPASPPQPSASGRPKSAPTTSSRTAVASTTTPPESHSRQIPKQKSSEVDSLNLCDKCEAIDWSGLPKLANDGSLEDMPLTLRELNESQAQLSTSSCAICRLLSVIKPKSLDGEECSLGAIPATRALVDTYEPVYKQSQCTVLSVIMRNGPEDSWLDNGCLASLATEDRRIDVEPRRISPDSIDFELIKSLLSFCGEHHSLCSNKYSYDIPGLRVIDVSTRNVITAPKYCRYAALSYVWGGSQAMAVDNDLVSPPPVIEDAILVAKNVGCDYLWVDRYVGTSHPDVQKRCALTL